MNCLNILSTAVLSNSTKYSSPSTISGLVNWYEADYGVTYDVSNNVVSSWLDKSGYGNTLKANVANNPVYVSSGINNKPAVQFNANSWYGFLTANSTNSTSVTYITVLKYSGNVQSATSGTWVTQQPVNPYSTNIALYGQVSMQIVGATNVLRAAVLGAGFTTVSGTGNTVISANQSLVASMTVSLHSNNYIDLRSWVNSSNPYVGISTINTLSQFIYNPLCVGSWAYNIGVDGVGPRTFNGYIPAIAIYNRNLSDTERQTVVNYFTNKYSI